MELLHKILSDLYRKGEPQARYKIKDEPLSAWHIAKKSFKDGLLQSAVAGLHSSFFKDQALYFYSTILTNKTS